MSNRKSTPYVKTQSVIRKVAQQVRNELESFVRDNRSGHFESNPYLDGMCGYGSVMLHQALSDAGFSPKIAEGRGHFFIICNGFLVDITASQFGQPKVVVRNYDYVRYTIHSMQYKMDWWNAENVFGTVCSAGLCNLKESIKKARNKNKEECDNCKKSRRK